MVLQWVFAVPGLDGQGGQGVKETASHCLKKRTLVRLHPFIAAYLNSRASGNARNLRT